MPRMCPACLPGKALHVRVLASIKTALAGEEAGLRKNSLRNPCPLKIDRPAAEKKTGKGAWLRQSAARTCGPRSERPSAGVHRLVTVQGDTHTSGAPVPVSTSCSDSCTRPLRCPRLAPCQAALVSRRDGRPRPAQSATAVDNDMRRLLGSRAGRRSGAAQ